MLIFAGLVSAVFAVVGRETLRGRLIYGGKIFAEFVGIALVLGWILYYLPL